MNLVLFVGSKPAEPRHVERVFQRGSITNASQDDLPRTQSSPESLARAVALPFLSPTLSRSFLRENSNQSISGQRGPDLV